jgi:hypothetical protein
MPWTVRAKMYLGFERDKYQRNGWFQKLFMLQNKKHFMGINRTIRNFNLIFQNKTEFLQMLQIFHSISYREKKKSPLT